MVSLLVGDRVEHPARGCHAAATRRHPAASSLGLDLNARRSQRGQRGVPRLLRRS
jgi:hypothetical protein